MYQKLLKETLKLLKIYYLIIIIPLSAAVLTQVTAPRTRDAARVKPVLATCIRVHQLHGYLLVHVTTRVTDVPHHDLQLSVLALVVVTS